MLCKFLTTRSYVGIIQRDLSVAYIVTDPGEQGTADHEELHSEIKARFYIVASYSYVFCI